MIRDLTNTSVNLVRRECVEKNHAQAAVLAEEVILDALLPASQPKPIIPGEEDAAPDPLQSVREKMRAKLAKGEFDERVIEISVTQPHGAGEIFIGSGIEEVDVGLQQIISGMLPQKKRTRKVTVREARGILQQQEAEKMLDTESVTAEAIRRVEQNGIIFIDEIDKIAGREGGHGPEVSREGVQRDILPIIEGSTINTRYGPVRTDHILFIAAGAFHVSKPDDLIPELQGRFPIKVQLESLTQEDFKRILTKPKNALIRQYEALLATEGVQIKFDTGAIDELARAAEEANRAHENIGARRLHTLMEKLLSDLLFDAGERAGEKVVINKEYLREHLGEDLVKSDMDEYIL